MNRTFLADRRIAITGATSGLGKATALALGRLSANLILMGRNRGAGEALTERILRLGNGANAAFFAADVSSQEQVRTVAARVNERWDALACSHKQRWGEVQHLSTEFGRN